MSERYFFKVAGGQAGKPRRIMQDFKLDEISAVDHPAQEGARMAILKRADPPMPTTLGRHPSRIDRPVDRKEHSMNFEQAVEAIQARDRCTGTAAMSKARTQYPDLYKRYQTDGLALVEIRKAESESMNERPREQDEFNVIADGIAARDKVSGTEAMRRAARQRPDLLAKLR